MKDNPDFSMLVGPEELWQNPYCWGSWRRKRWCEYVPRIVCELIQRREECRYGRSETFAGKSNANQCYDIYGRATWSSYLKGLKCALSLLGICSDYVAAPFHKFEQRERGKIWKALQNLGVDVVLR